MKILFINKNEITGGAGIAAYRLHCGLQDYYSTDNYFIVGSKKTENEKVFLSRKKGWQTFFERGTNYFMNRIGRQYSFFPFSSSNILRYAKEIKPDVISLHNILGGYFKTSLLIELSEIAPIIWTIHDMWAMTGNAAHAFGDESFLEMKAFKGERKHYPSIGINNGNKLLQRKKEIYSKANFSVVCPSEWLAAYARRSPVFEGKQVSQIFNGVDLNTFCVKDKAALRKKYYISEDAKVIIFSAENLKFSEFKGGKSLIRILESINSLSPFDIQLIVIGKGNLQNLTHLEHFNIIQTGYIQSEEKMADYLCLSDVLLYPTKADNLPNVLIESIACGTPAVTNDIGGCKEIIKDNFNGFIIDQNDDIAAAKKVIDLLSDQTLLSQFSSNARKYAVEHFDIKTMTDKYYHLFNDVLSKKLHE